MAMMAVCTFRPDLKSAHVPFHFKEAAPKKPSSWERRCLQERSEMSNNFVTDGDAVGFHVVFTLFSCRFLHPFRCPLLHQAPNATGNHFDFTVKTSPSV